MKFHRHDFDPVEYALWQAGLLLPEDPHWNIFHVKFRMNAWDVYSRVTIRARSAHDAIRRSCFYVTYTSPYRPEEVDVHAVYDQEDNLLWVDEPFYDQVQKRGEFRGMDRRSFLKLFGATQLALLYGYWSPRAWAGITSVNLSGQATGFTIPPGQQLYTTPGTYTWTVPSGVPSICVVCVGGGGGGGAAYWAGGGGGGGALAYKNNITVTPGQNISVVVGAGGESTAANVNGMGTNGGFSEVAITGWGFIRANGGQGGTGTTSDSNLNYAGGIGGARSGTFDGGGNGGAGGTSASDTAGGGGGAAGYSGDGGTGGGVSTSASNGAGGGGGGGSAGGHNGSDGAAPSGGGVGIYGVGANGTGGSPGGGGSGGGNGSPNATSGGSTNRGGAYGGGGGGQSNDGKSTPGCFGGHGAVRIIWGTGRSFPNNAS